MAKPEAVSENGAVPEKKPVRPFDGAENAKKFRDQFDKVKDGSGKSQVSIPGTRRSVAMTKVEADGKTVSIWTGTDTAGSPDFVVVNPPTDIVGTNNQLIEDPLTAIALLIDGATK